MHNLTRPLAARTHIRSIVVSERTKRKSVHVDGGSEKIDLRLPAPLDKHAVAHACYCMVPNKCACMPLDICT